MNDTGTAAIAIQQPLAPEAYSELKNRISFLAIGNASTGKMQLSNSQKPINTDVTSSLPKQLPRCERKVLQAVAMAGSADTTVLIIRSSTLAISAEQKEGEKKKSRLWSNAPYLEKHEYLDIRQIPLWTKVHESIWMAKQSLEVHASSNIYMHT